MFYKFSKSFIYFTNSQKWLAVYERFYLPLMLLFKTIASFIKGDVITKIDDVTITDVIDMQKEIYSHNVGDTVTVEYYRYGILNTTSVVLDK